MMDIAEKVRLKRLPLFSNNINNNSEDRSASKSIKPSRDSSTTASTDAVSSSFSDALSSSIRSSSSSTTSSTASEDVDTTAKAGNTAIITAATTTTTTTTTVSSLKARSSDASVASTASSTRIGFTSKSKNKTSNSSGNAVVVTTQTFVDAAKPVITRLEEHPFLVSMVNGTLGEESFGSYVLQDALYLHEISECLEILAKKAPTKAATNKLELFAANTRNCVTQIHHLFLGHYGIEIPVGGGDSGSGGFPEDLLGAGMPHTLMAASTVRRVVESESYPLGLAAVLPCVWVHMGVVVQTLLRLRTQTDNKQEEEEEQEQQERHPLCDAWIELYARRFKTDRGVAFLDSWCSYGMKMDVVDFAAMVDAECRRLRNHHHATEDGSSYSSNNKNKNNLQTMQRESDAATLKRMQKIFVVGCRMEHMLLDQAQTMLRWPDDDDDDTGGL